MHAIVSRSIVAVALVALPLGAFAQSAVPFKPATLLRPGSNTTHVAGSGSVIIQVFVKKDGSFSVSKIIKSTNPADNAAALEIAKSSTYKPALTGGKPTDSFYDYTVKFTGGAASVATQGPDGAALDLIRAGKYDQAKTQLEARVASNPSDTQAYALLGVASSFLNDPNSAAMAFDKAGTIPQQYTTLAAQSYDKYAASLLSSQKFADSETYSGREIALAPQNASGYYLRGVAEANEKNYSSAAVDLQKAQSVAVANKLDATVMATIDVALYQTLLSEGHFDDAIPLAKTLIGLDPSKQSLVQQAALNAYTSDASALLTAGKTADAVARLESGAAAFPAVAPQLYTSAGYALANVKPPDWKKVKAEADKALAADPANGRANYLAGTAVANDGDVKSGSAYMSKAKASPLYASDTAFAKQVDDAIKALGGTAK